MILIGLDCATDHRKVGLAMGTYDEQLHIHVARVARNPDDIATSIVDWLSQQDDAVLAIDAPLGWPKALGEALSSHVAGGPLPFEAHALFRRDTDREIKRRIGQQSLDVGADRIARTAHAALATLSAVRERVDVAMGWTPGAVKGRQAIEVYPAATLKAMGLMAKGYRGSEQRDVRLELIDELGIAMLADEARANAADSDHVFDAIVCVCAGVDYAKASAVAPRDGDLARREGWIWCRP